MRKILILSILIIFIGFLISCGPWDDESSSCPACRDNPVGIYDGEYEIVISCRHEAILTYIIFRNHHCETQICWGPSAIPGLYHAQSRARINGEWKWLKMYDNKVFTSTQDPFTVTVENVPLEEALAWSNIYPCH